MLPNKKWKMLKVKLQFFCGKKRDAATCFYYKATSQNYSLGGKWAATRPHNWKICQKYLTCLFFSSALTLYIFKHSWCQKKNMDLFCVVWRNSIRGNGIFWDLTLVAPWYPAGKGAEWKAPLQMKWRMELCILVWILIFQSNIFSHYHD